MSMLMGLLALPLSGCALDAAPDVAKDESVQATEHALTDLPDLIVESVTLEDVAGGVLHTVVIKNQGTADSGSMSGAFRHYWKLQPYPPQPPCTTYYGGTWAPFTGSLAAGASRTFTGTVSGWTISAMESCPGTWYTMVDQHNAVTESDETNNVKYGRD
ncbi:CARDB domain-containing protein [Sorangium sp. So ce1097]|uniref:CARDB domain-containing protein n=1 Tax=Sorangium sp. So ce1097 TaxID=3133330 RepID=UPI003F5FB60F